MTKSLHQWQQTIDDWRAALFEGSLSVGLHTPSRSIPFFTLAYTVLGLLTAENGSLMAVLICSQLGVFVGVIFPSFLVAEACRQDVSLFPENEWKEK